MALTGYLEFEDIKGESRRAGHEDQIEVFGASWSVAQAGSASMGSGRTRSSAQVSDWTFMKFMDASSPYLALSCMQGKSFDKIVFYAQKSSGDEHLDYLTITMEKCVITGYSMSAGGDDLIAENLSISCEKVNILYVVQAEDHSAGDEHEVEYHIVEGA